jgi:hypothetical protein
MTDDRELQESLRTVIDRVDPVPLTVTEFARAALGWRRLDVELAELLSASALAADLAALTRSDGDGARWLTFRTDALTIEVEVRSEDASRLLLGQLTPAAAARIEVQSGEGDVLAETDADDHGRFRLTLEATGRIRLRVLSGDPEQAPVETSWLSL